LAWISQKLYLDSAHDLLAAELLGHVARMPQPEAYSELLHWILDPGLDSSARAAAVQGLCARAERKAETIQSVSALLTSADFRVRQATIDALAAMNDPRADKVLEDAYARSITPRERRAIEAAAGTR
jgi:hypothetical protein